ncbi:MFS transporter [Arthrobacter agilis]|uniref:MFS transporter n=1 Tax=Arthrobacter agilis TaxID=37921 RepID=A0A2L0UHC5_9MICC|nr:MFS transporter [Arthrobacter agilis]AUZ88654.1 MFS transporter [Arthrobacter agilis]
MQPSEATPAPPSEIPTVSGADAGKIARAAFVGTALEWYDYFLFGTAAAIVFNRLFFTTLDPTAATLAAFATFGVGFAARPLGAVLFGFIGDRVGRRPALLITIVMIGCATGLIGVLPDFGSIGLAAPIMLAILRLMQGLAVGGEWGGAMTIAVEHAPIEKRGRYAALVQVGSPVGTLMSSGAFALVLLLPSEAFDSWGWRLPFLAAFPLLLIALYIRLKVEESPIFRELVKLEERAKIPALEVFRNAWGRLLVAVAAAFLGVGGFYVMTTFVISYGTVTLGLERGLMVNATLVAAVFQIGVVLVMGRLSERVGPGRMTLLGGLVTAAAAFPLFWLIDTRNPAAIILAVTLGIAFLSIAYAVTGALLTELFPPHLRYSGVALGYNLAGALSGFLPFIAVALQGATGGGSWTAALLLMAVSLITAAGGFFGERLRVKDKAIVQ